MSATRSRGWQPRGRSLALALVLWLLGCKLNTVQSPVCVSDDQCGPGFACTAGACITRGLPQDTWAIDLTPRSDSTAAPTQLPSVTFTDEVTVLTADAKTVVTGFLAQGSALAGSSHVVATVATAIPGRDDLQFETDWSTGDGQPPTDGFSLNVPAGAIGKIATFRITPLPPRDQAQPPVSTQKELASMFNLTVSSSFVFVSGNLVSPQQIPQTGFQVRAFQDGQLVSNVDTTTTPLGHFRLAIPNDPVYAVKGRPITVELTPGQSPSGSVRFVTPVILVKATGVLELDIGNLTMPTLADPNMFRFKVVDPSQQPVAGALVRVRTLTSIDGTGSAEFTNGGTSDASGNVDLTLIPGAAGAARPYDISVIPPTSSSYGLACVNGFRITKGGPISMAGSGDPPIAGWLALPMKATLSGTIYSADGVPVSGVSISPTRTTADASMPCATTVVSPPASTSSGRDGSYQLLLDPGTYQLDYDPPSGAPVPRLTQTGVIVNTGSNPGHVVQMLTGALIKGAVQGVDGTPLASVGVRFLEVACVGQNDCYGQNRVSPILRGVTHTDSDGTFRVVVPIQLPPP
jgi:hypothetical protein